MVDYGSWPDWAFYSAFLSPGDLHQTTAQISFGWTEFDVGGVPIELPGLLQNLPLLMLTHMIWLFTPLVLAYYFFKKRDI